MPAARSQVPTSMLLDTVGRDKVKRSTAQQILQLALPEVCIAAFTIARPGHTVEGQRSRTERKVSGGTSWCKLALWVAA